MAQINNYYPFGGVMADVTTGTDVQTHKYNGKELDTMHGLNLYDYSARQYDAALGMFTTMDPLCEVDYYCSPYAYCAGNPVGRIDSDGKIWNAVLGGVIGAAVEYTSQVAANAIVNKGFSADCFTENIDGTAIVMAGVAGFVSSGASAVESVVGGKVLAATGSKSTSKVIGKFASEAVEVSSNIIANTKLDNDKIEVNLNDATKDYAIGKVAGAFHLDNISFTTNTKARKNAAAKAGRHLTTEEKISAADANKKNRKNNKAQNASIDSKNKKIDYGFDLVWSTTQNVVEKKHNK